MAERRPFFSSNLRIPSGPLLVVGDLMCDHYVWGDVDRISPEAPVQVLKWEREADKPGGAANAAMNLAALGCRVHLVGMVGKDAPGRWLLRTLRASGIDTDGVIESPARATTLKTRVIARGQHMLRIDRETRTAPSAVDERRLVAAIRRLSGTLAGTVCSDYDKGVLSHRVFDTAVRASRNAFVVVDPKGRDFGKYRGADFLTPNEKELTEATPAVHQAPVRDADIRRRAESLMRKLKLKGLLVTRGPGGMDVFESNRGIRHAHISALQRHEVFDVTGAGDTVAAVLIMGVAAGMPLLEAARVANAAAGIVVGMVGTAVAEPDILARVIEGEASQARSKVLVREVLASRLADARAQGATIVFTSGSFETLNVDHLRKLQRARAQGELLVVGVNDEPPMGAQRAEMLAALRFVDYVTLFSERTPARLIRTLRPTVVI